MFLKRHYNKEIMDDFSITDDRIDKALEELKIINTFLGGNSISSKAINYLIRQKKLNNSIEILDVGSGGASIYDKVQSSLKRRHIKVNWTCIDLNIRACRFEKKTLKGDNVVCCNGYRLPFKKKTFEIIHASLFLHHFSEKDIIQLLKTFYETCRSGIIINDLRRNVFAYMGIKILTTLFSRSEMVKNDGPLSVKRGFVKSDLTKILLQAGILNYKIKRKWAFRWMVIISV
ncbi:MAG: methyltransferase domain-containing protein [Bacteroidota bacterium]|nr:methyltransferase domain-containing protein [Bacteroidota bacterium]MDP4190011.1 methyltransferase domain-containing protein [Bacteroidota bacterium]MDP4193443.1 methyltransferase domain-containing protein [Bacteroidota bacterium]